MDTFFLKTKSLFTSVPTQGIIAANYIYNTYTLDPKNTNQASYMKNAEFNLWRLQYDKFRVNSVKITCTPKANVLDQFNAQHDAALNVTGDGMIHTVIDRDSIVSPSIPVLSRYPSYRNYSVLKKFSRSYSVKYPTGIWIDCEDPTSFTMSQALGLAGGLTLYGENVLEDKFEILNEPWAQITVEYSIVFQGKTSNKLSGVYDENENLIGITINALPPATDVAESGLTNISGVLDGNTKSSEDASGNFVDVPVDDAPNV